MIAFKGFNKDLTCTRGKGTFQYEIGGFYQEDEAKTGATGFHCTEEPLEVLSWYPDGRFCVVIAAGDISESGDGKIACTWMKIVRELTKEELVFQEIDWILKHPDRKTCRFVEKDEGTAWNGAVVVRGSAPKATGKKGDILGLLAEGEEEDNAVVLRVGDGIIDPNEVEPGTYQLIGKEVVKIG